MAYNKTTWIDDVTPLNAENLNNMEDGIEKMHNATVNGKLLSSNPSLSAADVGALPASTEIPIVDKNFSPTSANAQSGKAVAEAIDPRTVYQKFIDDNKLKQRNWVDLSFVGGEYYYTDFLQAVADVNADTTVNSTTDSTNAVCQIFKNDEITVLRLLSDLSVTTQVIFEKSVIFDINGYEISLSGNGVFGTSGLIFSGFIKNTVVFYGAKTGSKITATDCSTILGIINQYFYILGGIIELNLTKTFSKSAYEITYVVNHDEDTLFEIINTNICLNDNRASGSNSIGIFFAISDIKNHIVNIFNSKIYTYSTVTATNAINISKHVSVIQSYLLGTFKNTKIMSISPADKGDNASIAIRTTQNTGILRLYDCYVEGMTSGIQNRGILYLNNCICKSPAHGGLYNANYGIAYLQNSEFHRNKAIDGYIPNANAAAYFGYSSTAYLNDCSFILDAEGDTSDGIAIKQGNTTEPTYVYMSNCELPKLRCDSGQYVYLGEGISDTIKNATVNGTKVLTDENYSTYINKETGQPVIDIEYEPTSRSPQSGIAVAEAVATEQKRADNTFSNALKGSKSGSAILIDDVSPVTHEMSVKISSIPKKNLLNRLIAKAYSSDMNVPTEDFINTYCSKKILFKQGTTYTFSIKSVSGFSDTVAWAPRFYIFDNGSLFVSNTPSSPPVTFNTDFFTSDSSANNYVCQNGSALWSKANMITNQGPWSMTITPVKDFEAVFIVTDGAVTDSIIVTEAQIEVGSTATNYVPYIENPVTDLTAVKVTRCGKNLLPLADSGIYYNGSISSGKPFIYNSSLSISNFNDIDVSSYRGVYAVIKLIEGETYTLTIKNLVNNCATKQITLAVGFRSSESTVFGTSEKNNSKYSDYNPSSFTFTVPSGYPYCLVGFYNYPTVSGDTISFDAMQLELGTTATTYEPYITTIDYAPNADGTVNGVTSLYPSTTLMTDTEGVMIDCEYNRDINKAFAELQAAIISSGGNV